jgi:hypothetical protein
MANRTISLHCTPAFGILTPSLPTGTPWFATSPLLRRLLLMDRRSLCEIAEADADSNSRRIQRNALLRREDPRA